MPTYDYKCNECEYVFEEFHKMSDPPVEICPRCGGKVRKLVSGGAGIHFKGSGFYVNDYKSKSAGGESKSSSSTESSK